MASRERDPARLYQPIWCKGRVNDYYKFQRDCDDRYRVILDLAKRFNRPFSVLDIGSNYGYFPVRLMEDTEAVCVLIDDKEVVPVLKENLMLDRSVVIKRKVTAKELESLARSESFDVVLALSVLHHFDDPERAYKAIRNLGWWSVFEVPGEDDVGAAYPEKHQAILDLFHVEPSGHFDSHVSECMRPYFVLENQPHLEEQSIDAADRDAPGYTNYHLRVDFDGAYFGKSQQQVPDEMTETRPFVPGMNLYNFIRLGGGWPTNELIELEVEQYKGLPDFQPWNFIVGRGITPIDMERK